MRRTKISQHPDLPSVPPTAILTSDWHLRETQPPCRTDNFWGAQWKKVAFISFLQKKYDCPVVHAGDLFHHWKPSPYLLSMAMEYLPKKFFTVYGNHDLPQHNLDLAHKSGIHALEKAGKLTVLPKGHVGQAVPLTTLTDYGLKGLIVWHKFVWVGMGKLPWPGCTAPRAEDVLRKLKHVKAILTGDNHQCFCMQDEKGRWLINPGSLTRQTVDQIDHKPTVFLWYGKSNKIVPVELPIEKDVISRDHIKIEQEKNRYLEDFVKRLSNDWNAGVSFETNLKKFFETNDIRQPVQDVVWWAVDKAKEVGKNG